MVAVFQENGISLPRTSEQQYAQAPIKNQKPLLPGDLVFSEGVHPGHVGLYIGGGMVLEDPHTGDHVKTVPLSAFGWNGESARWWGGRTSKNTSGMSNDPMHDAGGGNQTPTTTTTPTPTPDVPTATHPFVEKPGKPKHHADPLAGYRLSLRTGIAQINDDVEKGLLPRSLADRLQARAEAIQASLRHATKADIPKIRTEMRDLNAAVATALRATRDGALLGKDEGQIRTDVKDGLLSRSVGDTLIAQARAINQRLVADIFDPKRAAADDQAARGFRARIAAMLSQAAEVRSIDQAGATAAGSFRQQLEQALGIPVQHATEGAVAKARAGVAKIRAAFASDKVLAPAEITKLKQQLSVYQATIADGMQGVLDKVNSSRTKFETSWSRLSQIALFAFDKATQKQLAKMQADAKKAIDALQVTVQGSGFASFLFGGAIAQTPSEKALADRQRAQNKAQLQQNIDDARKALSDAQSALSGYGGAGAAGSVGHGGITLGSGDTVFGLGSASTSSLAALQQAVVDAQKQLDQAIETQQDDALSDQATAERDAADKQLQAAKDAAQAKLDQQAQDYQDARDLQRQHLQEMLDDELAAVEQGKKPLSRALSELGDVLGMSFAQSFGTWYDPSNPGSVTATLAQFLYQVNVAKGQSPTQAALGALGALPPATTLFTATTGDFKTGFDANGIPIAPAGGWGGKRQGFASGGWAGGPPPTIDPRDTIPAMLRRGELVLTPEDQSVFAGMRAGSGGGVHVHFHGGTFIGSRPRDVAQELAPHISNALERQVGYTSARS